MIQKPQIIITNKAVYNILKKIILIHKNCQLFLAVKGRIDCIILSVLISKIICEFLLQNSDNEYEYYHKSSKISILKMLINVYSELNHNNYKIIEQK